MKLDLFTFQKVKWFTAQILTGKLNLALIFTYRVEIYLLHGMVTVKVLTNLSHLDRNLEKNTTVKSVWAQVFRIFFSTET